PRQHAAPRDGRGTRLLHELARQGVLGKLSASTCAHRALLSRDRRWSLAAGWIDGDSVPRQTQGNPWNPSHIATNSCPVSNMPDSFRLAGALLADVAHDVLDARVVLEAVHRQVLAVPRVLEAAVRHLRDERDVRVDPHDPEVQTP